MKQWFLTWALPPPRGAFDFWGGRNIQGGFLGALKVYGIYLIAETFSSFLENTLILGEK